MTLQHLTPDDVTAVQRSAHKAVRLHLATFGHRDPVAFREDVTQEAFLAFAHVADRVAHLPVIYGPTCQPVRQDDDGRRVTDCQHDTCQDLTNVRPSAVVLAAWAAKDAVRDVLAHDRHAARPTPDVTARLAAEAEAMLTPDARLMGTADRKPQHAFTSDLRTAHVDAAAFLRAFDVDTMPTLTLLLQTASDSRRGGVAAWAAVGRVTGETSGHGRQAVKARAEREWAVLADRLATVATLADPGRYEGNAPEPTLTALAGRVTAQQRVPVVTVPASLGTACQGTGTAPADLCQPTTPAERRVPREAARRVALAAWLTSEGGLARI
ncbi:MAG: hypothetical protein ACXVYY_01260 [Oryzihumus sp.]